MSLFKSNLSSSFQEQITRLRAATGLHTQAELAACFGVDLPTVEEAAQNNKIPAEWLLILLRVKQVSPEWVLSGQGPCFLGAGPGQYETGEATAERWTREKALQRFFSRAG